MQSPVERSLRDVHAQRVTRRTFLMLAGGTSSLVLLAACRQPGAPEAPSSANTPRRWCAHGGDQQRPWPRGANGGGREARAHAGVGARPPRRRWRRARRRGSSPTLSTPRSRRPGWIPQENPPQVTPYNFSYTLHDALVKPMPGKDFVPSLAESYEVAPDFKSATFKLRTGHQVPRRHAGHARGRQVHLRAVPGRQRRRPESEARTHRDPGRPHDSLLLQGAVRRLPDDLRQPGQRGRLDRAEGVLREGRQGRLQDGADRGRAVSLRAAAGRQRDGVRGVPGVLAEVAERQDDRREGRPGGGDPPGDAPDGRDRRDVHDPRRPAGHGPEGLEAAADGPARRR